MSIQRATEADAEAISDLIRPLAEKFIVHELSEEGRRKLLADLSANRHRRYLREGYRYHLFKEGGELVGVVGTRDDRHLFSLFVAERAHGQGIARRLWDVARQACLAAGGDGTFTVNASRYAVRVYESFGFEREGPEVTKDGVLFVPMRLRAE